MIQDQAPTCVVLGSWWSSPRGDKLGGVDVKPRHLVRHVCVRVRHRAAERIPRDFSHDISGIGTGMNEKGTLCGEGVDTLPWTSLTDGEVAQRDVRIGADASDLLSLVDILELSVILRSNFEELFSSGSSGQKSDEHVAHTRHSSVAATAASLAVRQ